MKILKLFYSIRLNKFKKLNLIYKMPSSLPELKKLKEKEKKLEKKLKVHVKAEHVIEKEINRIKIKEKKLKI